MIGRSRLPGPRPGRRACAGTRAGRGRGVMPHTDLIFLAENRPIFLRLRVTSRGRPFEASWIDSVQALHASLDRNGDGTLTTKEADPKVLAALVRLAAGAAELPASRRAGRSSRKTARSRSTSWPRPSGRSWARSGSRSAGSRSAAPMRSSISSTATRTAQLTRPELAAIAGSLRPLDLDDNEMISGRRDRALQRPGDHRPHDGDSSDTPSPRRRAPRRSSSCVAGESSFRPARLLLKKYDKGKDDVPGRPDGKLSPDEFAIDPGRLRRRR